MTVDRAYYPTWREVAIARALGLAVGFVLGVVVAMLWLLWPVLR